MRAANSRTAIGTLSASVLEEDERLTRALGADFFMRKPYDYGELLDRISRLLAGTVATGQEEQRSELAPVGKGSETAHQGRQVA
jgi:DNA-binding response OmpR family regulator